MPELVLNSMKRFSQRLTQQSVDAVVLVQQLINIITPARELGVSAVCELTLRVSAPNFTLNELHANLYNEHVLVPFFLFHMSVFTDLWLSFP